MNKRKVTHLKVLIKLYLKKVQIKHKQVISKLIFIKNNYIKSNFIKSTEIPICFEKMFLVYGHNTLSASLTRCDILDKLKTSIKSNTQNDISKLVAQSPFGTNYLDMKQNTED